MDKFFNDDVATILTEEVKEEVILKRMCNIIEHKLKRVTEPDDPQRCQAVVSNGQCPFRAVVEHNGQPTNGKYCQMHLGASGYKVEKTEELRNYRLQLWKTRVDEFADSNKIKCLREEIGILRIIIEEILAKCEDSTTLILYSSKITEMVMRVEKLVLSCHKLESHLGELLDKVAAMQFANEIVAIIGKHIKQEDLVALISNDITAALSRATQAKAFSDI